MSRAEIDCGQIIAHVVGITTTNEDITIPELPIIIVTPTLDIAVTE
jgi:hypothetical protein